MSQSTQVAVAGPSSLADPTRPGAKTNHNIPGFLLKLYEIVNDPANEALVKWSEAGDSFYIFNQERFAREVLGKWFKHQNFSSFVRQLNLYGFRKISALQQGLLRTDPDNETIHFAHPYFHRGQPDLLALIQRRRNISAQANSEDGALGRLQSPSLSSDHKGQAAIDVHSVVEGINAIRRQQQAIAADLSALKQSNDALWKEAIEARERHAKHEDTINRILKFLAGLFGRAIEGQNGKQLHGDGKAVPTKRLMIGDGRECHGESGDYFAFEEHSDAGSRGQSPFSVAPERFATIETPGASVASPAPTISEVPDTAPKSPSKPPQPVTEQPVGSSRAAAPLAQKPIQSSIPSAALEQNSQTPNPACQATLQQILNSPAHLQQIMQTFANAQPYNIPTDQDSSSLGLFTPTNPLQQLIYPAPVIPSHQQQLPISTSTTQLAVPPAPLSGLQNPALVANTERINKTYQDAAEISADVDALQSNIHALVRDMGLDPNNISLPTVGGNVGNVVPPNGVGATEGAGQDFPFDSWFNEISSGLDLPDLAYPSSPERPDGQPTGDDLSAFLNIPPFDGAPSSSVVPPLQGTAPVSSPSGMKRKMEVVEVPEALPGDAPSAKRKR